MKLNNESLKSFEQAKTFSEHASKVNSLSFSFDGQKCLASSDDDSISIYLISTGTRDKKVFSKKYGVTHATFTKNSDRCIYGSNKKNDDIRYHDLNEDKYIRYFSGHQRSVVSLANCNASQAELFLSGSQDRTLRLWDVRSSHCQGFLKTQGIPIGAFDPEGCIFAAGIDSNIVRLYDIRTFDKGSFSTFHVQNTDKSEWKKLEFSGDGRQIMITTDGGSAKLIDAFSGDLMGSIRATGAAKRVGQSCYTPDGSMIVNGDETGKVHVYDSKRGQLLTKLPGDHPRPISAIAFNPKAMMMATACNQVCFWLPTIEEV